MKRKPNILKDALLLFAITVVAGALLGAVNHITKDPIAKAQERQKTEAYQAVLSTAVSFEEAFSDEMAAQAEILSGNVSDVTIEAAVRGVDGSGNTVGYIITATSAKSYGGDLSVVVGYDTTFAITGIQVLEINDTPGLGMKAKDADFKDQYVGKNANPYAITKSGASADSEIDAISSATITSNAFNDAVNGASCFVEAAGKEGSDNE